MAARTLRLDLDDEEATRRLGEDIAAILASGDLIALSGDLGMGKTALARAIVRALADDAGLDVPSPTFTLVQTYALRLTVHHFDLYRLSSPDELEELGFHGEARDGVVLVEWPERAADALPGDAVFVRISERGEGRAVEIEGPEDFIGRLERSLAIRAFLDRSGLEGARRSFLIGDASSRAYETVSAPGREPIILMNAPRRPDGPPIRDGKPYSRIAHLAESVVPFVAIARVLRDEGFAAPDIPAADLDRGLLLVENLGSEGVLDSEGRPILERYTAAGELLARMHGRTWPRRIEVAEGVVHDIPSYDRAALSIETELLTDWYVPHSAGRRLSPAEREAFTQAWAEAFDVLDGVEKSLVLRDFHSPNIIWRPDRTGHDRIGLIDFQDSTIGPSAYDVASLALDARVTIPAEFEAAIVEAYCVARPGLDRAAFDAAYAIMAAQRNSKILGIFVRLDVRDGKPAYLKHLPRIRDYVARALGHPALDRLRAVYREMGVA